MAAEALDVEYVRELIETRGFSYADVSRECQMQRPGCKGCSVRSIRRFCAQNNGIIIHIILLSRSSCIV